MQYDPSCAQAGVQFGSQLHGFKPGDAVKKAWEMKFGFVTFGIEVQVSAHYSQWFCMVKGRQRGRSVGGQGHLWFGTCQKYWPQCPSWIRELTGQSVP